MAKLPTTQSQTAAKVAAEQAKRGQTGGVRQSKAASMKAKSTQTTRRRRRGVVLQREKARSNAYTRNTIEASKNKPLTQTGSQGSGGGRKPPSTKTAMGSKEPSRGSGGRTGLAKRNAARKASSNGPKRISGRTERVVGSGTATKKALPGAKAKLSTAAKIGKVAGRATVVAAGASEVADTVKFKSDKRRPTVQEHAKGQRYNKTKNPKTGRGYAKGVNSVNLGVGKNTVKSAQAKAGGFNVTTAGTGAKKAAAPPKAKVATPTKKKASSGGWDREAYRAKQAKRKKAFFAKTKTGKAQAAAKNRTSAKQQGKTTPNYQHPPMKRRNGNEHRQNTYTGDRESTSKNLAKISTKEGGGEEKGFWTRKTPAGYTRQQWLIDQVRN